MIVDTLTHVWESPGQIGQRTEFDRRRDPMAERMLHADPNEHFESLGPANVAFVLAFQSELLGGRVSNKLVAEYARQHADRLIAVASVDPTRASARTMLEHSIDELGMRAVAVSPSAQGFHPMDSRAVDIYQQVAEMGVPLIIYGGPAPSPGARLEFAQPVLLDEMLRELPQLKVVLGSLGSPFIDQGLGLLAKHANLLANLGGLCRGPWMAYNVLLRAYELGVIDRLLFSSDFPYSTAAACIETLYSINQIPQATNLPAIPRELLRGIVERDALGLLGLAPPGEKAPAEPPTPGSADDEDPPAPNPGDSAGDPDNLV